MLKSRFVACAALVCLLAGCGNEVDLYNLKGTVTFDGKPVPYGRIEFTPDNSKGNSGGTGYAVIEDGKYDTSTLRGRGTIGGPHIVKITAFEAKPTGGGGTEDAPVEGSEVKPLFVGYEIEADLPTSSGEQNFDVPASAEGYDPFKAANERPKTDA